MSVVKQNGSAIIDDVQLNRVASSDQFKNKLNDLLKFGKKPKVSNKKPPNFNDWKVSQQRLNARLVSGTTNTNINNDNNFNNDNNNDESVPIRNRKSSAGLNINQKFIKPKIKPSKRRKKRNRKKKQEFLIDNDDFIVVPKKKSKKVELMEKEKPEITYDITQKITIVGCARVGKTSLKKLLSGKEFSKNELPTVKLSNRPAEYNSLIDTSIKKDLKVKYELYDTPGQVLLFDKAILELTGKQVIIIMFAIDDIVTYKYAINKWLLYLEDKAKGYDRVILVGNKYDNKDNRMINSNDVHEMIEDKPIINRYMEISCKTQHKIDKLINLINKYTQTKIEQNKEIYKERISDYKLDNFTLDDDDVESVELKEGGCLCNII